VLQLVLRIVGRRGAQAVLVHGCVAAVRVAIGSKASRRLVALGRNAFHTRVGSAVGPLAGLVSALHILRLRTVLHAAGWKLLGSVLLNARLPLGSRRSLGTVDVAVHRHGSGRALHEVRRGGGGGGHVRAHVLPVRCSRSLRLQLRLRAPRRRPKVVRRKATREGPRHPARLTLLPAARVLATLSVKLLKCRKELQDQILTILYETDPSVFNTQNNVSRTTVRAPNCPTCGAEFYIVLENPPKSDSFLSFAIGFVLLDMAPPCPARAEYTFPFGMRVTSDDIEKALLERVTGRLQRPEDMTQAKVKLKRELCLMRFVYFPRALTFASFVTWCR
jgi:hypothetical protein